jgi:hypothetical protein
MSSVPSVAIAPPVMRNRILVSVAIGVLSAAMCWAVATRYGHGAADFEPAWRAARDLVAGRDPYAYRPDNLWVPYPLPAAIVALPLAWLPPALAGAVFVGLSSALLAFGLSRQGYAPLLLFLSYPYLSAAVLVQWTPLLMAGALFPFLLPVTLAKPNTGLPIALTHLTRVGVGLSVGLGLGSLLVMPDWPLRWLSQVGSYQRFVPLLLFPGPLLLVALARYRDRDARLLLLAAAVPQRWFYDCLLLWLIPKSTREVAMTSLVSWASWGLVLWKRLDSPPSIEDVGRIAIICCYVPMLVVVLLRTWAGRQATTAPATAHAVTGLYALLAD